MKNSKIIKGTVIFAIVLATAFVAFMIYNGFLDEKTIVNIMQNFEGVIDITEEGIYQLPPVKLFVVGLWLSIVLVITLMANMFLLPLHIISANSRIKSKYNKKFVESDTYIYTRDLPDYNASVAGALYDFKSTFEEDYIAGVLDLIAKGYIIEHNDHLLIDVVKKRDGLLKNEIYILENFEKENWNSKVIINWKFYKALKEDMYDLGLYQKQIWLNDLYEKFQYYMVKNPVLTKKVTLIALSIFMLVLVNLMVSSFKLFIILFFALYIVVIKFLRKNKLTKLGEDEKESMTKLKYFLERETDFKDKESSENRLWDRYPAFAVALGVNKEMSEKIIEKLNKKYK